MSVAIYRNRLNGEMKRFSKFGKQISSDLSSKGIKVDIIYEDKKNDCLKLMKQYDTIVIISHGSACKIYHKYDFSLKNNHQLLISTTQIFSNDRNVLDAIKDKKIIAIACGTATTLGDVACINGGCKSYLGFKHKIHFTKLNKKKASNKYHEFLIHCYKDAFSDIIEKSIYEQWKFSKLKLVLSRELRRVVMERAKQLKEERPYFYSNHDIHQAILAVVNVSDNIEIFGDSQETVS